MNLLTDHSARLSQQLWLMVVLVSDVCVQVWSCSSCFSLFHLPCIQKWAKDSAFLVSSATDEDFGQKQHPWPWWGGGGGWWLRLLSLVFYFICCLCWLMNACLMYEVQIICLWFTSSRTVVGQSADHPPYSIKSKSCKDADVSDPTARPHDHTSIGFTSWRLICVRSLSTVQSVEQSTHPAPRPTGTCQHRHTLWTRVILLTWTGSFTHHEYRQNHRVNYASSTWSVCSSVTCRDQQWTHNHMVQHITEEESEHNKQSTTGHHKVPGLSLSTWVNVLSLGCGRRRPSSDHWSITHHSDLWPVCGVMLLLTSRGLYRTVMSLNRNMLCCVQVHVLLWEDAGSSSWPLVGSSLLWLCLSEGAQTHLWTHLSAALSPR